MNLANINDNKTKMIFQFSIPSIVAMVLTSLITLVDGYFVGNYVGSAGIAAINLGLPIIYLFLASGLMISVGGASIAGISFGQDDQKKCRQVFNQTICTTIIVTLLLSILLFFSLNPILNFLAADQQVAAYFKAYYYIMLLELPVMVLNNSFGMFIRGEGNPQYFMKVSILNVVLNFVLDYLFTRWLSLGIRGIAVASLIAAVVTLCCILFYFFKRSALYKFKRFIFSFEVMKHTFLNGSSEFIGEMSLCISMFAYNYVIMQQIGVNGVTAFAIVGYISFLFSMIMIGFGQGIVPLISFTYGAKEYLLSAQLRRLTNRTVFLIGGLVFLIILGTSGFYAQFFVRNSTVEQMVSFGARLFALSFLFSGINTIASFYFTSIGRAFESAVISSARGLVLLLICIFTLPMLFGMTGVWLVAVVTEVLTLGASLGFLWRDDKRHRR